MGCSIYTKLSGVNKVYINVLSTDLSLFKYVTCSKILVRYVFMGRKVIRVVVVNS